ncbi:MAG: glutathione synthase [Rhodospirillales bacterium]|nr:glutathione synthase [Rhodospirillales bacterium]
MTNSKTLAIQMDPIESININADSSFVLAMEAQARGYRVYHYQPQDLSFMGGLVSARARALTLRRETGNHFTLGDPEVIDLNEVDVVLMRQDPPFDMAYITATHLLEHIHPDTLVVNDPASVRNAPEKLFATLFPDLMPPTLITRDVQTIKAFRSEYKDIIIKPLYGNGGAGVFHVPPGDDNLNALLEMFAAISREPVMVQAYLPDVRAGDKRIILIDGEAAGAINRVPEDGDVRANMHAGGTPLKSSLTNREFEICETIGPELKRRGLIFTGIDVIGNYLTEINVTSPTGIQEINRFDGVKLEAQVWDAIEARLR